MNKSQSKRAVQARRWRDTAREKRRINNVIAEYVQHKYKDVYNECYELYEALKKKYPNLGPKCDLTKTAMFKRLIEKDSDSSSSSDEEFSVAGDNFTTTTNDPVPAVDTCDNFTTTTSDPVPAVDTCDNFTTTTSEPVPAVDTCDNFTTTTSEPVPAVDTSDNFTTTTGEPVPAVDTSDNFTTTTSDPVPAASIPVHHLHINYNSLGEIVEELIDEGEYVNMNALHNELLDDIINDLERDESIQEILNDYNVQPMEQEEDDDEGIGLNLENEIEELLDFDFEFDF